MAGGTWTRQNKARPGVYIRFASGEAMGLELSERGVVTICEPLSWGPVAKVMELDAGADFRQFTGYQNQNPKNRFLNEIFKGTNRTGGPSRVLLFRPSASGSAKASVTISPLTATAKYEGIRGNDISVAVTELSAPEDTFTVTTIVDGEILDSQTVQNVSELISNDWVDFSGTGTPSPNTGVALTGGIDGTVQAAAYLAYLTAIEPYSFDIMIYDGADQSTISAMTAFMERMADEAGVYSQLVAANMGNPDSRFAINVMSGATLSDGTALTPQQVTWWVGGAMAGAQFNESLTYASYPDAVDVSPRLTNSGFEDALQSGQLVLFCDNGTVKIEQDINSLVTYTAEISQVYRKNRVIRLLNTIANDIFRQFSDNFIGVTNNNEAGRMQLKAAVVGYLFEIEAQNGIQNFASEDVTVEAGEDIDAVLMNIALWPVDSAEKIYITITVN